MSQETPESTLSRIDVHVRAARLSSPDMFDLATAMDLTIIGIAALPPRASEVEKDARRGDTIQFTRAVPGRSQWVHVIDPWGWQESAFGSKRIAELDRAVEIGACGGFLSGDVGQRVTSPAGATLMHDDDVVLGPVLRQLGAHKKPLWLGPIDDRTAWDDASLERPDYETVIAARDRMLEQQPDLRVIGLGMLGHADDLDAVARRLDRYANLAVALDGAVLRLMTAHSADALREFFVQYQDRVLYATGGPDDPVDGLVAWFYAHEVALAWLSRRDPVRTTAAEVEGLGLPEPAVRRIYRENALRWIPDLVARGLTAQEPGPLQRQKRGPSPATVKKWLAAMPATGREMWSVGEGNEPRPPEFERVDAHAHVFVSSGEFNAMVAHNRIRMVNIGYVQSPMSDAEQVAQQDAMVAVEKATAGLVKWVVGIDPYGFEDAGWAEREIARIDAAFAVGAIGVKIVKNVGLTVTRKDGGFLMPDDAVFAPVLDHIARAGRTLYLHVGDPIESWQRPDPASPHFRAFQREPLQDGFLMYPHTERPSYEAVIDARDRLIARHPDLRIVGCHMALQAHDLLGLARRFDRFPNYVVDTSAAHHQLMHYNDAARLRAFFTEYSDRILYGSDKGLHPGDDVADRTRWLAEEWERDWKWLSTRGLVSIKAFRAEGQRVVAWDRPIECLGLPQDALLRIYFANARRWVPGI